MKIKISHKHTAGRGAAESNAEGSPAGASRAGASELQHKETKKNFFFNFFVTILFF